MKDLLISVYEHNLALLRDENEELLKTNSGLIEGNIVLRNRIENLSKAKKPTKEQINQIAKIWNDTFRAEWDITPWEELIELTITEWEKIRGAGK